VVSPAESENRGQEVKQDSTNAKQDGDRQGDWEMRRFLLWSRPVLALSVGYSEYLLLLPLSVG
jgi:hypothetical protein